MADSVLIRKYDGDVLKTIQLYILSKCLMSDVKIFCIDALNDDEEEDNRAYFKTRDVKEIIQSVDRHVDASPYYAGGKINHAIHVYATINGKDKPFYFKTAKRHGVYKDFYLEAKNFLEAK